MRIWIDIANTPQVRFFQPVERALTKRGHEVRITVRDHRETAILAREAWPGVVADSGASPDEHLRKGAVLLVRAASLARRARSFRPEVALSHNSYAQLLAARFLGIPSVTAMDYEHQPANHLAFRLAHRVVVPDVFPEAALRRFGASKRRVRRYEGLKEEMYLQPTGTSARPGLGLGPSTPLAVVRLPPDGALYHGSENLLLEAVVEHLRSQQATVVVLARSEDQRRAWRQRAASDLIVIEPPVDAQALLRDCSVFIGAGGTMTREAALIGAPTFSIFAGEEAAADRKLEAQGRLAFLRHTDELDRLDLAQLQRVAPAELTRRGGPLDTVLTAVEELRPRRRSSDRAR